MDKKLKRELQQIIDRPDIFIPKVEVDAPNYVKCVDRNHYSNIFVEGFCRKCGRAFSLGKE